MDEFPRNLHGLVGGSWAGRPMLAGMMAESRYFRAGFARVAGWLEWRPRSTQEPNSDDLTNAR